MNNQLIYNKVTITFFLLAILVSLAIEVSVHVLVIPFYALAIQSLYKAREAKKPETMTYRTGVFVALAMMAWVFSLPYLLLFVILLIKPIEKFSLRNFVAMLLGFLTPFWIAIPILMFTHSEKYVYDSFVEIQNVGFLEGYSTVSPWVVVVCGLIFMALVFMAVRYNVLNYKGGNNTRVQHAMFVTSSWVTIIAISLFPQHSVVLLPLLIFLIGPMVTLQLTDQRR